MVIKYWRMLVVNFISYPRIMSQIFICNILYTSFVKLAAVTASCIVIILGMQLTVQSVEELKP